MNSKIYKKHMDELKGRANLIAIPCPGLMDLVEQEDMQSPAINELLEKYIGRYRGRTKAVALGCTHYPFVERQIREILGDIDVYNGADGVARELARSLMERGLLSSTSRAEMVFESSDGRPETAAFYRRMLELFGN